MSKEIGIIQTLDSYTTIDGLTYEKKVATQKITQTFPAPFPITPTYGVVFGSQLNNTLIPANELLFNIFIEDFSRPIIPIGFNYVLQDNGAPFSVLSGGFMGLYAVVSAQDHTTNMLYKSTLVQSKLNSLFYDINVQSFNKLIYKFNKNDFIQFELNEKILWAQNKPYILANYTIGGFAEVQIFAFPQTIDVALSFTYLQLS